MTIYGVTLGHQSFTTRSPHVAESFSRVGARVTAVTSSEE